MSSNAEADQSSVFDLTSWPERARNVVFGDPNESNEHEPGLLNHLLLVLIGIVVVLLVFKIIEIIFNRFKSRTIGSPYLVPKTKDAQKDLVIAQDPRKEASIPLRRSLNEQEGLEFSYVWWMYIEDFEYKKGSWKHVFHKGGSDSWPNRAPGVWLHPNDNKMRVYMNSYKKIANYVDIDNIPVGKWFSCGVVVTQNYLDVYINWYLKSRLALEGIPDDVECSWKIGAAPEAHVGHPITVIFEAAGAHDVIATCQRGGTGPWKATYAYSVSAKYVRKELTAMTDTERSNFLDALQTTYSVGQSEGEQMYGIKYKSMAKLVSDHLQGAADKQCDHWHDDAGFANHHVGVTLQFERSLQSVDASVAVHYWDYTVDAAAASAEASLDGGRVRTRGAAVRGLLSTLWGGSEELRQRQQVLRSLQPFRGLSNADIPPIEQSVVWNLRLSRALVAALAADATLAAAAASATRTVAVISRRLSAR